MKRLVDWLVAALLLLAPRRRAAPPRPEPPGQSIAKTHELELPRDRRMEALTAVLLVLSGVCGAGFVVFYFVDADTQFFGLTLGLSFVFLAGALVVAGKKVVPQETAIEEKEYFGDEGADREVATIVKDGGEGISRRGLLGGAAAIAGTGLGAAILLPVASLGPNVDHLLAETPWTRGRALVDEEDQPIRPEDITLGGFVTAFPEGADKELAGSPLIVCRMRPDELALPPGREDWAVDGIVAYSKVCTHAGCAIAMFRYPLYAPNEPHPALVCPCHYSTFDPRRGAKVDFGPAGRPLPQLPLGLDADGRFVAEGPLSGPPGPAYPRVRSQRDT